MQPVSVVAKIRISANLPCSLIYASSKKLG